ncbi:hypothetical protein ACIBCT_24800 [Streptosporangium sp. NPDC050855]|uniref:hypothetical protein n=1 Tax=Streptosporangium sp. NPDC050855 TaxID=3366194 RepID=UPI0037B7E9F2
MVGAHSFRDPEEDLPKDFVAKKVENYAEPYKPLDPKAFIEELKAEMRAESKALNTALPKSDWVGISERKSEAIKLTKINAAAAMSAAGRSETTGALTTGRPG